LEINADLIARNMLRRAAEFEQLTLERDAMAQEIERLRAELAATKEHTGPWAVPNPEEGNRPA
jgi:hypothetical protein